VLGCDGELLRNYLVRSYYCLNHVSDSFIRCRARCEIRFVLMYIRAVRVGCDGELLRIRTHRVLCSLTITLHCTCLHT
jgi:hypothetical protein